MNKAHVAYESKRHVMFLKFIREKRGLSHTEADRLLGFYRGWTKRMEKTGLDNYAAYKVFVMMKKYKVTADEPAEFLAKYPRNKKYKQVSY
jgi:hypothetical protein